MLDKQNSLRYTVAVPWLAEANQGTANKPKSDKSTDRVLSGLRKAAVGIFSDERLAIAN